MADSIEMVVTPQEVDLTITPIQTSIVVVQPSVTINISEE